MLIPILIMGGDIYIMKKNYFLFPFISIGIILLVTISATGNSMIGSKHDLGYLNQRAFGSDVGPMQGTAYIDFGEICVYCHTPHNADPIAPLWNRQLPSHSSYKLYSSPNFDSKNDGPDGISLACLSCHDGTVAVDAVVNQPKSREIIDTGVHYKMKPAGDAEAGGDSCGKCHDRGAGAYGGMSGAHDATLKYLQTDLTNDHPISVSLPPYNIDQGFNQPTIPSKEGGRAFPNGVKTFAGDKIQCASCHNPHDPDERNAEGRDPFLRASNKYSSLCLTCHQK